MKRVCKPVLKIKRENIFEIKSKPIPSLGCSSSLWPGSPAATSSTRRPASLPPFWPEPNPPFGPYRFDGGSYPFVGIFPSRAREARARLPPIAVAATPSPPSPREAPSLLCFISSWTTASPPTQPPSPRLPLVSFLLLLQAKRERQNPIPPSPPRRRPVVSGLPAPNQRHHELRRVSRTNLVEGIDSGASGSSQFHRFPALAAGEIRRLRQLRVFPTPPSSS